MSVALTLLNAVAALGSSAAFNVQNGGDFMYAVAGTFGGATVTLETLGPDGSTWISLGTAAAMTTAGLCVVSLPPGRYRATAAGGAGPYLLSASLKSIL